MKINLISLCATCLACVVALASCDIETVDVSYLDYEHASKEGVIPPDTWLPHFLPKSAKQIQERHNNDTNETWVSFFFDEADISYMTNACIGVKYHDVKFPRKDRSSEIDWWINDTTKDDRLRIKYFQCDANSFLIINEKEHIAYFWRNSH